MSNEYQYKGLAGARYDSWSYSKKKGLLSPKKLAEKVENESQKANKMEKVGKLLTIVGAVLFFIQLAAGTSLTSGMGGDSKAIVIILPIAVIVLGIFLWRTFDQVGLAAYAFLKENNLLNQPQDSDRDDD